MQTPTGVSTLQDIRIVELYGLTVYGVVVNLRTTIDTTGDMEGVRGPGGIKIGTHLSSRDVIMDVWAQVHGNMLVLREWLPPRRTVLT